MFSLKDKSDFVLMYLYLCHTGTFTRTGMNKLSFIVDLLYYIGYGRSLSGYIYLKLLHGTVPAEMDDLLGHMYSQNLLSMSEDVKKGLIVKARLSENDLKKIRNHFGEKITLFDRCMQTFGHYSDKQFSDLVCDMKIWQRADMFKPVNFRHINGDHKSLNALSNSIPLAA